MTFLVEDGSAVDGATSLTSVARADSYHSLRLNTEWASLDQAVKEAKLIEASSFFSYTYAKRLPGTRKTNGQTFHFPAENAYYNDDLVNVIEDNIVPNEVQDAVCELALVASTQSLTNSISEDNEGQSEESSMAKLGSLQVSTTFAKGSRSLKSVVKYPAAHATLYRLLKVSAKRVIR